MAQGMYEHLADDDRGLHWSFLVASELERSRMNRAAAAGEWDEAQAAMERSLSYLPETQPVIDMVGALEAAERKGEADRLFIESLERMSSALGRYRQSALLNNQAAWLAASCNRRLDTALNLAQTAVACDPGSAAALDTLAEVYLRTGQPERARELLEGVLALAESQDVGNAAPYGQFNAYLERRQEFLQRLEEPAAGD
jgi:tetratricopeptide (TPR) repeat protein